MRSFKRVPLLGHPATRNASRGQIFKRFAPRPPRGSSSPIPLSPAAPLPLPAPAGEPDGRGFIVRPRGMSPHRPPSCTGQLRTPTDPPDTVSVSHGQRTRPSPPDFRWHGPHPRRTWQVRRGSVRRGRASPRYPPPPLSRRGPAASWCANGRSAGRALRAMPAGASAAVQTPACKSGRAWSGLVGARRSLGGDPAGGNSPTRRSRASSHQLPPIPYTSGTLPPFW